MASRLPMFAEKTDWHTQWMERVTPIVESFVAARPDDAVFTRFVPPQRQVRAAGRARQYFEHWRKFTLQEIDPAMIEIIAPLRRFVPPALVVDKPAYSPFGVPAFHEILEARGIETIVVSGAETDVCVLSTILSAVDAGYLVVAARDALCSSSDQSHDALIGLYRGRFGQQVALCETEDILSFWRA